MNRMYMAGGQLEHVGNSMRELEVGKSKAEIEEEAAESPKHKATLEQSIALENGRLSMRSKSTKEINRRTSTMLKDMRAAEADAEEKKRLEDLENLHYMKDLEAERKEARHSNVTYRPSRKPGEGPNIQRDSATYSRLINNKKYSTFRKNMEKHQIQKKVGDRAGEQVQGKGAKLSIVAAQAHKVYIGDD